VACEVENPQENLTWLKTWLQSCICEDIYQYSFDDKEYIIIESCPYASDPSKEVFNCNGDLLCYQGGFGGDCPLPNAFWETYEDRKILIFEHRYY